MRVVPFGIICVPVSASTSIMIIGLLMILLGLSTQVLTTHKVGHYHLVQFLNQMPSISRPTRQSNHTYVPTATIQQPRCVGVNVGKENSSGLSLGKESLRNSDIRILPCCSYYCKPRTSICKEVTWYRKSSYRFRRVHAAKVCEDERGFEKFILSSRTSRK